MDIEQLKIILESLDNVTDGAKTVAIWWIVGKTLLPVIGWSMLLTGLLVVSKNIISAVVGTQLDTALLIKTSNNKGLSTISGDFITHNERARLDRELSETLQ